ncbi:hypothetical protein H1220_00040 [Carnobacteriaceae bacterium zg-84]|uniref:hypothetical protein n=1 Tax=Granulicatella sp. zg-84 TaxID=2678503 RepID=UPI0013C1CA4E|nr:hypothetical protein [Granulicatella sp. zg-84]NEW66850.1 hypothetical protein [Granulicatella sp. zg-84]QMI85826.1 hypothetical protein H1220_00040 [Carnobacteriaceae bacterium zg-84]
MKKKLVLASAVALLAVAPLANSVVNAENITSNVVERIQERLTPKQERELGPLNKKALETQVAYDEATKARNEKGEMLAKAQMAYSEASYERNVVFPEKYAELEVKEADLLSQESEYNTNIAKAKAELPALNTSLTTNKATLATQEKALDSLNADLAAKELEIKSYSALDGTSELKNKAEKAKHELEYQVETTKTAIKKLKDSIAFDEATKAKLESYLEDSYVVKPTLITVEINKVRKEMVKLDNDTKDALTKAETALKAAETNSFNAISVERAAYVAHVEAIKELNHWLVENGFPTVSEAIVAPSELSAPEKDAVEGKKPAPAEKAGAQAQQGKKVLPKTSAAK